MKGKEDITNQEKEDRNEGKKDQIKGKEDKTKENSDAFYPYFITLNPEYLVGGGGLATVQGFRNSSFQISSYNSYMQINPLRYLKLYNNKAENCRLGANKLYFSSNPSTL